MRERCSSLCESFCKFDTRDTKAHTATQADGSGITQTKFLPVTFRLPKKKQASKQARKHASKRSMQAKTAPSERSSIFLFVSIWRGSSRMGTCSTTYATRCDVRLVLLSKTMSKTRNCPDRRRTARLSCTMFRRRIARGEQN